MTEDGFDSFVCVEGSSLGCVASDQSLGMLDSQFCSFVGGRIVGSGDPVDNSPFVAEVFKLFGGEHLSSISCQGDWDAEGGDVVSEARECLGCGVLWQFPKCEPVAVSVDRCQVALGVQREEVSTDALEGICRLLWFNRRHSRVARGVS